MAKRRRKRQEPKGYMPFCANVPKNYLRILRCLVQDKSFESVSAGFREMMECWFVDNFGHNFEAELLNKYKDMKTPLAHRVGIRPSIDGNLTIN